MARGFWRGVITGGLIGAAGSIIVLPQLRPDTREQIMARGRDIGGRARDALQRVRRESEQVIEDR
jgi:gas vesicle protein